ncbi:bifunctional lysylphosphatidylglycerol flippase/synthetase MprF [Kineococcus sp. SYSU DK001]|uniref:bifunctional lysylphosphatidylglycerol flippase/synthetase MprF n=1 Tax=Kineococcus sp. SYSU DK001 TaxID=3383122 RepID=UPI003D7DD98F
MSLPTPAPSVRRVLTLVLGVGLLVAAAALLHRTFRHHPWHQLGDDLLALGPVTVAAAVAATACSYLAMTGYDAMALRHVGHRLPYRRYGFASFVATAFGNNLGASAVVGAALRARAYATWKVPGATIARIIGFNLLTLALGAAVLAGGGMLHDPAGVGRALRLPPPVTLALGAALLAAVVAYLGWAVVTRRPIGWRQRRLVPPAPRLAVAQVVLSTVEWLTMAAVLFVLLPADARPGFLAFAVAFAVATIAGLVSNVPGGLGVFESTLVVLLGATTSPADLAVALVAYRLVYYVVPLLLAAVLLAVHEVRQLPLPPLRRPALRRPTLDAPFGLALVVAAAGVFMLVVGDLPCPAELDLSGVTTSLAGLAALLAARGLRRRLKGAWAATLALLTGVTVVSAGHGDVALPVVTACLAGLLVATRSVFYRGAFLCRRQTLLVPVVAVVLVAGAVWWQESSRFTPVDAPLLTAPFAGGASAADRVAMAAGILGVFLGVRWISRATTVRHGVADPEELDRAGDIVARNGRCLSQLAFTGDKRFWFSPGGEAFLMYQVSGRSWIVMGDPVGNPADFRDLVADFLAEVDRHDGRPVFYNVRADHADLYRESGLSLAKLGEEAVLPLADFSFAGKAKTNLRNCRNKSQKLGMSVEFVAPQDVEPLLPELRVVSEAWLGHRNGKEKRFSLGAFDEEYVARFPLVVVRQEGRVIAFATLWIGADDGEVQVDLMRRLPDGPRTVMTYLFVECIAWAQENGFTAFSLGMAPLAGLRTDESASMWDRIGHLLWTHGEQFYNFKGLREFKQGFLPQWRTCYVAAPGGPDLPNAMVDVVTLVGGGLRGVLRG